MIRRVPARALRHPCMPAGGRAWLVLHGWLRWCAHFGLPVGPLETVAMIQAGRYLLAARAAGAPLSPVQGLALVLSGQLRLAGLAGARQPARRKRCR